MQTVLFFRWRAGDGEKGFSQWRGGKYIFSRARQASIFEDKICTLRAMDMLFNNK